MEGLRLGEILHTLGGKIVGAELSLDTLITGISTDSRKIKQGEVFVALVGEKMDGHDYISVVEEKAALLCIVSKEIPCKIPLVIVDDTLLALNSIAGLYRQKYDVPVIAVTGSNGKTSTKEIVSSILENKLNVHKTKMNYNNEIGLPMTIFEMDRETEVSILELGMNHEGEIKRLTKVAKPLIGIITNIGSAHIENLGSRANILKAKLELTTDFDEKNLLIINGDDEYLKTIGKVKYEIKKVSLHNQGDYNAEDIINLGEDGVTFSCKIRNEMHRFRLRVPGIHNVYNALVGIAVGDYFNLTVEDIRTGLEAYRPVGQRMNIVNLSNGIKLINDYYNANPDSMKAALDVLGEYEGRRIAVLGDMYELGEISLAAHSQIGKYAIDKSDLLIAVGISAKEYMNSYSADKEAYYFATKAEALGFLKSNLDAGDIVLIKASNGMEMGEIADNLIIDREKVIK